MQTDRQTSRELETGGRRQSRHLANLMVNNLTADT